MITPEQCRAARSLLGISQQDLCKLAGITHKPLVDFERGNTRPYAKTLEKLKAALEEQGAIFIDPSEESLSGGAGVRLAR